MGMFLTMAALLTQTGGFENGNFYYYSEPVVTFSGASISAKVTFAPPSASTPIGGTLGVTNSGAYTELFVAAQQEEDPGTASISLSPAFYVHGEYTRGP